MHNKSLHGTSSPPLRGYKLARELKRYTSCVNDGSKLTHLSAISSV
ncbi:hypothetical protein SAMN05216210_2470 [Halopseudomonas salegens]|uniref:Uncharacterized protein n=1 Tax=Halopseudomonas salegens TaxID=1434072 RepID=A0A1H2GPX8_9GAMM|nr:hypothetical protein SAMN05216210_2470 [Halopseudomonas salegens]